jgi:ABC-type polysaccharide/polyol phosphate export permease
MHRTLWRSRALLLTLVKKDLKVRYKASALGFLWSFGRPLLLMLILWGVFSHIVRIPLKTPGLPYSLHLLGGVLPWMFFSGAIGEAIHSLLGNSNVIKKVAVPTEVFPAACVFSHWVHFILALLVLTVFMLAAGVWPDAKILWLPILMLAQTLFMLGLALLLAGLHVFYRDVASLTEIGLTAWFYLTPVIYPLYMVETELGKLGQSEWFWVYLLNPMAGLVAGYRHVLFGAAMTPAEISAPLFQFSVAYAFLAGIGLWLLAAPAYRKLSRSFADEL